MNSAFRLLAALIFTAAATDAQTTIAVEDLGQPVLKRGLGMRCVTRDSSGMMEAWAAFETADRFADELAPRELRNESPTA